MKLKDIGERRIIDRLMSMHSKQVPKDDCALIEDGEDYLLLSTDVITPLTHAPKGASPEQIGSFFANINLSDIAGMAGEPIGFMSAYSASPDTDIEFFEG
ncbi:MAG TPA: AIR synthase related protein, partial [Thermoplasmataceae archaeon]|nr:AIR synthase related protein [Thermoplasmataceae archaeon]